MARLFSVDDLPRADPAPSLPRKARRLRAPALVGLPYPRPIDEVEEDANRGRVRSFGEAFRRIRVRALAREIDLPIPNTFGALPSRLRMTAQEFGEGVQEGTPRRRSLLSRIGRTAIGLPLGGGGDEDEGQVPLAPSRRARAEYTREIKPLSRVREAAGDVADVGVGKGPAEVPLPYTFGLLPTRVRLSARQVAEAMVPTTVGDIAMELAPGVGTVPGVASAAGKAGRAFARGAREGAPGIGAAVRATGLPFAEPVDGTISTAARKRKPALPSVSAGTPEVAPSGLGPSQPAPAAGVPPTKPPGGVATLEPPPEGPTIPPVRKLAQAIKAAGKATPEQQRMFAQERARRTAISASVLERGQGPTAFKRAKAVAGGEFPRPQFETPVVTTDDIFSLTEQIRTSDLQHWQKINAENALTDVLGGRIPQPAELEHLRRIFGKDGDDLVGALSAKRGLGEKVMAEIWGAAGLPQALQTTLDISSRFRQGAVLGWSNPRQWAQAWKPALRSFATEEGFESALKNLERDPWIGGGAGDMAGFSFREVGGHLYSGGKTLSGLERGNPGLNESMISRLTQRIPGIRASERDYAMFLDQIGGRTYAKYAQAMWDAGVRDIDQYKAVSKVINHARGYGDFSVGQIAKGFNAFYSGRNLVSRFQVILDPILQPGGLLKPSARQLAAKNLAGMIIGDLTLLGLVGGVGAALGVASLEMDPRSTDWGKIRVGNTRIDPWAGFAPMVRLVARGVTGETKSETGGFYPARFQSELLRFFRNKQSPLAGMLVDQLLGQTTIGEKPKAPWDPNKLAEMFAPFWTQDVMDAAKQTGLGMAPIVAPLAMTGFGTSSYSTPSQKRDEAVITAIKAGETYTDADGNSVPLPTKYRAADGTLKPIRIYADLKAADPLAAEAFDKAHAKETQAVQERQSAQTQAIRDIQADFAKKYAANDKVLESSPAEWRKQRAELKTQERSQLVGLGRAPESQRPDVGPRTNRDVLNDSYAAAIEAATDERGVVDWDQVDRFTARLTDEERALLYSQKLAGETPASREYYAALQKLEPYFTARDQAWAELQRRKPELYQDFRNYDEFRKNWMAEQAAKYEARNGLKLSNTVLEALADRELASLEEFMSREGARYLVAHKELIPLLDKWGYRVPAALRKYTLERP